MIRFHGSHFCRAHVAAAEDFIVLPARVGQASVPVIEPQDESCLLPRAEPLGQLGLGPAVEALEHGVSGKGAQGRSREVEKRNEQQRPERGPARRLDTLDRVEPDDDMRKPGRSRHERQRHAEHIELVPAADEGFGVGGKTQIGMDLVKLFQQRGAFSEEHAAQPDLRNRRAGILQADGDGRRQESGDEHPVLRHLGPCDPLHAAKGGVDEDNGHANIDTYVDVHFEESGEHDSDTPHLACNVGE